MLGVEEDVLRVQVDRILHSDELRSSEVLRRLLKFLADKSLSGEADHLKEYTVAIDGLGKPPTYDPQHNSAVRIQVGRLRQKLGEYYRSEGKQDDVIIDLPKGRFKLTCEQRSSPAEAAPVLLAEPAPAAASRQTSRFMRLLIWLGLAVLAVALGTYGWEHFRHSNPRAYAPGWTPDLQALWAPFIDTKQPLILAIEDPLFVELNSEPGVYYRDKSLNDWNDVVGSSSVAALRHALKNPDIKPSRYYTAYGEVEASFLLGGLLTPREQNFSVVKSSQLSWQDLADNNVLFVGVESLFFAQQLHGMPLAPQLVAEMQGIRNVHPQPGEPALYQDSYSTAPSEQGAAYALVTHLPGPLGSRDVESFTSSRSAGYVGAVQWFTDPNLARVLVAHLKNADNGKMPRYYQVLLKVKFRDDVPTETTYVLSRVLR